MEHLFDNREFVQSLIVTRGNKASVATSSKKYKITLEEVIVFFHNNLNDEELAKISTHLSSTNKGVVCKTKIIFWCEDVIKNALTHYRSHDYNSKCKMSLRELFMERIALNGCALAVIFLKKYFYKNTHINTIQHSSNKHNVIQ